jgi:DNA ligase (NAD+)
MTVAQIVKRLIEAKEAYYKGEPIMTDADFDALEEQLREEDPDNKYFSMVGSRLGRGKIEHKIPMLSAGKAKTPEEVNTWADKVGALTGKSDKALIVEPKIDGLSATAKYKNGKLVYIATRGDGKAGQDVSHIADYIGIPKTIKVKGEVEVRGELYLPKNTKFSNPENKPLRNICVGLVNRKDDGLEDLKYVKFVAYQMAGHSQIREQDVIENLKAEGFHTIDVTVLHTKDQVKEYYENYLKTLRAEWEFETDGLILVVNNILLHSTIDSQYEISHHHHYNIALKPPSEGKETKLVSIEWNMTRLGRITPVAIIEPVVVGGATITRCTLNNLENVMNLKMAKGDKIIIERANDVIPFFKENLSKHTKTADNLIPTTCPSCGGKVSKDGVHLVCKNKSCKERVVENIIHWVKNCELDGVADSTIRALFDAGKIKEVKDLYSLKAKDFEGLEGFGERKITNVLQQIEAKKEMTIEQFIDRLGIDLVGEKAAKKLEINTVEKFLGFEGGEFVIAQNLKEFLDANRKMIENLLSCVKIKAPVKAKAGARAVCMTGAGPKTRNELVKDIQAKGDFFVDHVSKDTQILVCEDPNGETTKLAKARKLGIQLMSYKQYFS